MEFMVETVYPDKKEIADTQVPAVNLATLLTELLDKLVSLVLRVRRVVTVYLERLDSRDSMEIKVTEEFALRAVPVSKVLRETEVLMDSTDLLDNVEHPVNVVTLGNLAMTDFWDQPVYPVLRYFMSTHFNTKLSTYQSYNQNINFRVELESRVL